jgi:hypothetical protein
MEHLRFTAPIDTRTMQNQPTSTADSPCDEAMGETDEPPDERKLQTTPSPFFKKISCAVQRKQSLLTRTFHSSESDSQHDEDVFSSSNRAHSSASTWSRGSFTSTADLTSDGHTSPTRTPSPPPPPSQYTIKPIFNSKPFDAAPSILVQPEAVDPSKTPVAPSTNEDMVEAFMKRKRCIMFSCGKKEEASKKVEPVKVETVQPADPPKRACMLKFGPCPTRDAPAKPSLRLASPPPPTRSKLAISPKVHIRSHRGSDSTVRNDSPKSVRKMPSVLKARRSSMGSDFGHNEATRFHEFASSEEEVDEWTQEATCHRSRLTIDDTLKVENDLRQLGKEAEDEAMEEEELDEDVDDEDDDEDDDNDSIGIVDSTGYISDEGFASDDEHGFAGSDDDDESDAGSDYAWWAPGASATGEQIEHIRPRSRRSNSTSSVDSFCSTRVFPSKTPKIAKHRRSEAREIRPRTPDLPDSTDFVCGTLDEDRPLEQAYISCLEQRRAAKHKILPQDIDPTFPASDPEMEEEDEDTDEDAIHVEDSDHHVFIHGHPDVHSEFEERQPRGIIPRKRSPPHSPRRMRSPPPTKRAVHRSPPPRRLFGQSPKRMRSPPPGRPLRSPPPTRRTSFAIGHHPELDATPVALGQRPNAPFDFREASSVPRNGPFRLQRSSMYDDEEDDDAGTATDALPTRGAIDIVKGLEKKRQRRHEKLMEKHARQRNKGKEKHRHFVLPGKGAERMREMGMELAALRGKRPAGVTGEGGGLILSY